jgi:hypothetical protein
VLSELISKNIDGPNDDQIMLKAKSPTDIANNAFLKLCKLDVREETEKWARTGDFSKDATGPPTDPFVAPKFSLDGRVAVVTIESGFQSKLSASFKLLLSLILQYTPSSPPDGPVPWAGKARN